MSFLADESVESEIVKQHRRENYLVQYIAELAPGIPDAAVLAMANQQGAILLTADKDFGELVYRQRQLASGVVLIRLRGVSPIRKAEIAARAINDHFAELPGSFTVISPGIVRIRR